MKFPIYQVTRRSIPYNRAVQQTAVKTSNLATQNDSGELQPSGHIPSTLFVFSINNFFRRYAESVHWAVCSNHYTVHICQPPLPDTSNYPSQRPLKIAAW